MFDICSSKRSRGEGSNTGSDAAWTIIVGGMMR
ncbi:hypothetical protein I3842_01G089100 [Carya illinoinensis]|uniref:Uncharacterized protein n=1 Tax=Carya illinoinensis TaxID=32201 RepID=A0A922G198_CARIL|nr:hypothetical protein I3842_01G089100 [Carya illinoinensis]